MHGRLKRNNDGAVTPKPAPRGMPTAGNDDYSIVRAQDGHAIGRIGAEGANAHYPNADPEAMLGTDEDFDLAGW